MSRPTRRAVLAGAIACASGAPSQTARPCGLRVMTFNVRVPIDKEPARRWKARLPVAAAILRRTMPDLIGTQELVRRQGDDLAAALPAYAWFGRDRRGGHDDEHMGLFYRRDRLRLLDRGDFWLSDTPTVPGSASWGNPYPRMVTWGDFETRGSAPRRFRALNTHLPYRTEDAPARLRCADAIVAHIATLPRTLPVVLTGDFNTDAGDAVHARLAAALSDARDAARHVSGPAATFHGFGAADDRRRIDWIMTRGFTSRASATIDEHVGKVWPSDHHPVIADLDWS